MRRKRGDLRVRRRRARDVVAGRRRRAAVSAARARAFITWGGAHDIHILGGGTLLEPKLATPPRTLTPQDMELYFMCFYLRSSTKCPRPSVLNQQAVALTFSSVFKLQATSFESKRCYRTGIISIPRAPNIIHPPTLCAPLSGRTLQVIHNIAPK